MQSGKKDNWLAEDVQVFWGEIAPCDHVVHIYEDDHEFLNLLEEYVIGGIRSGDSVIIIATPEHITSLNNRLRSNGFDPFYLQTKDKYIPLDAEQTLNKFMIDGWPDESLFLHLVSDLLLRAKRTSKTVRAYGEMVAILWSKGLNGATVQLEHLWNKFMHSNEFCLFCAYPRSGFTEDPQVSIRQICNTHSKVVHGARGVLNTVMYTNTPEKIAR
jgi:hypothetical protein